MEWVLPEAWFLGFVPWLIIGFAAVLFSLRTKQVRVAKWISAFVGLAMFIASTYRFVHYDVNAICILIVASLIGFLLGTNWTAFLYKG